MMHVLQQAHVLQIAAKASCDARTVQRYLNGLPVRNLVRERIEAAMKALKIRKGTS
jgi:DNA-binding LacI/PurR family transcriptional regulator